MVCETTDLIKASRLAVRLTTRVSVGRVEDGAVSEEKRVWHVLSDVSVKSCVIRFV